MGVKKIGSKIRVTAIDDVKIDNGEITLLIAAKYGERYKVQQLIEEYKKLGVKPKSRLVVAFGYEREQRSNDVNAYFHVLATKISEKLDRGMQEVKERLVCDYGTAAVDENGETIIVELPSDVEPKRFYPYPKWIGSGGGKSQYLLMKQTSTLDGKEMSKLIDGVIAEAKELGIETKTPEEIANLKSLWESKKQ